MNDVTPLYCHLLATARTIAKRQSMHQHDLREFAVTANRLQNAIVRQVLVLAHGESVASELPPWAREGRTAERIAESSLEFCESMIWGDGS